uniref:Si:dkeyp-117b8.4 n=1 Tax=Cyprinus carpio TaxID=7962 RepID=A0A8C2FEU3_CYPCA
KKFFFYFSFTTDMDLPPQRHPGSHSGQILRRRMQRFLPFSDRRTSKVWNHYTQLSLYRVECNHCKRQLSFHNSTTSMREHLGREMSSTAAGSSIRSGTRACSDKRAEVLTDLILEMVFRDLQPLSVVEERGFKLLLSCLEPNYPVPSPSLLGSLLWHRYHNLKQCLQQHLQTSLASHCLTLCTEYWRSVDGCGVDGDGQYYLTVSAHFVDSQWRLARCVLETRPIAEFKGSPSEKGQASFADTLRAVLSEFQLPEDFVFCVVHDTPSGSESRGQDNMAIDQEYQQEFAGPRQALKLCVQEGLCVETVRQALADARAIVLHFQHDVNASTALSQKAEAVNKESASLVLNDPGRWTTAIEMCESLLELKWVISSVLEEQKVAANLADHQWRLVHELVPVLKTVRIAASFLSEDINGPISALMPCLQGVSRLLGQKIAECTCPVVRGVMERIRAGMDKHWSLSDEDALLDCPAVFSSFLDPRFKELRFLSPHAQQVNENTLEVGSPFKNANNRKRRSSGTSMTSPLRGDLQLEPRIRMSPLPQSMYDILLGEDPTERMPEIHQQLENYIAEPLCRRSLSPLQWWRNKEHRFPAVARLARKYLSIPATSVSANRVFAPRESPVTQRRATLGSKHLDHILFLHQNTDYVDLSGTVSVETKAEK